MKESLYSDTVVRESLSIATRDADGTTNGASVDRHERLQAFRSAMMIVVVGTITDGTHTFTFEHSDDETTWEDVPAQLRQGDILQLTSTSDGKSFEVGYLPTKRFVRATVTVSAIPALGEGGTYGAFIQLGQPRRPPTDHSMPS